MQKQDWIQHIGSVLSQNQPFILSYIDSDKASLIFACDVYRRRKHPVTLHFEATLEGYLNLHVTIMPYQSTIEITVKRDDEVNGIVHQLANPFLETVTIRGCGTVINTVCSAVQYAIHNGWYVDKSFVNTLVQLGSNHAKQRNTTLCVFLRRGSC